jgi:Recombination endonuclease VII
MPAKGTKKGQRTSCTVDGCFSVCFGHGFCNLHYKRWKKYGDPLVVVQPKGTYTVCTYPGCERSHQAHGLCAGHNAQRAAGRTLIPIGERRARAPRPLCTRPGCTSPGSPYCSKHYARLYKFKEYGVTWEIFDALWEACEGNCSICSKQLDLDSPDTHLDHCHSNGGARGILCRHCNQGLGQFRDDPALLESAIRYLRR